MIPVALLTYLKPLQSYLDDKDVSEICINKPKEVWVERNGRFKQYDLPMLNLSYLQKLACLVAEYNKREISSSTPTLSASLPNGERAQFVIEPACDKGSFICSIRKPSIAEVSIGDYFSQDKDNQDITNINSADLLKTYFENDYANFLKIAVKLKKNIVISGGTSTGKTTFLNALLSHISFHERIITIETDREVKVPHPNKVHLLATEEGASLADTSMLDLLKTSLRLRPDRILVSEIRGSEAYAYLRAINSGHPGSITTLHADSPKGCFEQLTFMMLQAGTNLSRLDVLNYTKSVVDIVVQIKRNNLNKRYVSEIYFKDAEQKSYSKTISLRKQYIS